MSRLVLEMVLRQAAAFGHLLAAVAQHTGPQTDACGWEMRCGLWFMWSAKRWVFEQRPEMIRGVMRLGRPWVASCCVGRRDVEMCRAEVMGAILAVGGVNGTVCKARAPRTEGGHYALARRSSRFEKIVRDGKALSFSQRVEASSSLLTGFAASTLLCRPSHPSPLSLFFSPSLLCFGRAEIEVMSLCLRFKPLFTLRDTGGRSNSMLVGA